MLRYLDQASITAYSDDLRSLFDTLGISDFVEGFLLDHVAVKVAGAAQFDRYISKLKQHCVALNWIKRNDRRLAVAMLAEPVALPGFGRTTLLEVLEPRPEASESTVSFFEHVEFYHPRYGFDDVVRLLEQHGSKPSVKTHAEHRTASLILNNRGQEVKFTDVPLADVVRVQWHALLPHQQLAE